MKDNKEFIMRKTEMEEGCVRFNISGHINATTAMEFELALNKEIALGHVNIIINMAHVRFLSSVGIRIILKTYKQCEKAGGLFKISAPSDPVRNVIGLSSLDQLLLQ